MTSWNNILQKIFRKITDIKIDKKYIRQKKDLKIIAKILPNLIKSACEFRKSFEWI